jgi:hypothetical protein
MRITLLLLGMVVCSSIATSQTVVNPSRYALTPVESPAPQCVRPSLTLKEGETDAAMGGVRATDYVFTNTSSSPCTLNGYPRVELLSSSGVVARRAMGSDQLPGTTEKTSPQLVTLEPGKTAWFRLYYNSGGAGHIGKACPTYHKLRIVAPETTRAFLLRTDMQSCRRTELNVSAVRSGAP